MTGKDNQNDDKTPTQEKIRAIVRNLATGDIQYETVIPQALITILVVGGCVAMYIMGRDVPDALTNGLFIIIGFYFGSDYQYRRTAKKGN